MERSREGQLLESHAGDGGGAVNASWARSRMAGLDPTSPMDPPVTNEVNRDGRLFRAAAPILERIRSQIAGERLSVMLVDAKAEMLTTVNGCQQIDAIVERIGATPGAVWREETTGTNALATPFETRAPIFVRGRDHYVERLKDYSCYGAPILNPVNGRLVGVLDIMSDAGAESALMQPFIDAAVADIQENIKRSIGYRTQAIVNAFEEAARHPASMVVALSRSMVLQSSAAAGVLSATDIARLRDLAGSMHIGAQSRTDIELSNGCTAQVSLETVDESDGVIVRLQTRRQPFIPRSAEPLHRRRQITDWINEFRVGTESGVIVGEPGTGRTTALSEAGAGQRLCTISARLLDVTTLESELSAELHHRCHDLLVVDDLDQLPVSARGLVGRIIEEASGRVLASATEVAADDLEGRRLLDMFPMRLDLVPLRARRAEVVDMLNVVAGRGVRYRFTPRATRVLETYPWRGNLRELSAVAQKLERHRGALIDVTELPMSLRAKSTVKTMTPWQQASCDAIMQALEISHGNKAHAADYLGISRSTLYHHIREYGIAT